MNNAECGFSTGVEMITTLAISSFFNDFFKAVIGPELEKALGRKPTDRDWQVYWEESGKRAEFDAGRKIYQEWQAQAQARRSIHNFVWHNDT